MGRHVKRSTVAEYDAVGFARAAERSLVVLDQVWRQLTEAAALELILEGGRSVRALGDGHVLQRTRTPAGHQYAVRSWDQVKGERVVGYIGVARGERSPRRREGTKRRVA